MFRFFTLCVHARVCVRQARVDGPNSVTSFVPISCCSLCVCTELFPAAAFFHYTGNWKGDGDYFFLLCISPTDEFMHLKRSFVTRELALHACALSTLPWRTLHHQRLRRTEGRWQNKNILERTRKHEHPPEWTDEFIRICLWWIPVVPSSPFRLCRLTCHSHTAWQGVGSLLVLRWVSVTTWTSIGRSAPVCSWQHLKDVTWLFLLVLMESWCSVTDGIHEIWLLPSQLMSMFLFS